MAPLRFLELASAPDVSFWAKLADMKLNELRLSEEPIPARGHYRANTHEGVASPLNLTADAFDVDAGGTTGGGSRIAMRGEIHLVNTLEKMKTFDRAGVAARAAERVRQSIASGAADADPSLLNTFAVVCFADLKRFMFYYWVCVPAAKDAVFSPLGPESAPSSVATSMAADNAVGMLQSCEAYHAAAGGACPCWIVVSPCRAARFRFVRVRTQSPD